ncbi:MAG: DUF2156 domain-containing protein [Clostridia bacterium]|nr:DUF2156 domain-containing protein [Clostridia bacterium]
MIIFEPLNIKHKDIYNRYTAGKYRCSEASFSNMYIWRKVTNAAVAVVSDMLVLRVYFGGHYRFVMPFGNRTNTVKCVDALLEYCLQNGYGLEIIGADTEFADTLKAAGYSCTFTQDRNVQDYVYSSEKLASLSGKKLHSKKNHVNKFKAEYKYEFVPIDKTLLDNCINKTQLWMNIKYDGDSKKYSQELDTVKCLLENFDEFNLFGGAILVDGELAAYTVGERLTEDTALVHIEKADTDYNGAFAIINYEFANFLKTSFKYINREEDMGIEGLRRAKESYRPEFFTDKIKCKFQ